MAREEHNVQAFVVPSEDQRQFNSRVEFTSDDHIFIQTQANTLLTAIRDALSSRALAVPLVRLRPQVVISVADVTPGCAVVTLTNAYLFTDGRYFLQAEQQLDKCVIP